MLSQPERVGGERVVHRRAARSSAREAVERPRVAPLAKRPTRVVQTAVTEPRSRRRPGGAVAWAPVGARLRAEREQLAEIGDRGIEPVAAIRTRPCASSASPRRRAMSSSGGAKSRERP